MITGKVFIFDIEVYALIDSGYIHFVIASNAALCLHIEPGIINKELNLRISLGRFLIF